MTTLAAAERGRRFAARLGCTLPVFEAPMAGSSPARRAAAIIAAGGMGACGALPMDPAAMKDWAADVRADAGGPFQINLWVPDPEPIRDRAREAAVKAMLETWGPIIPDDQLDAPWLQDFEAQCQAVLDIKPAAASSVMGLFPPDFADALKRADILWFAGVTTVGEAQMAEAAGADVLIVQGAEAGGHRASFDSAGAEATATGLFALLPAVAEATSLPLIAAGGIADGKRVAAAMLLGASAVLVGSGLLRAAESTTPKAWADALEGLKPEDTILTRAFSGRLGRGIATDYTRAWTAAGAPEVAPYPVQRVMGEPLQSQARDTDDLTIMQAWAGQAAALAETRPAGDIIRDMWADAEALLKG